MALAHSNPKKGAADDPLSRALKRVRRGVFIAVGFSLFLNLLHLASPLYMMQVYDRVLPTDGKETLFFLTIIAVVAALALGVLEAARSAALARLGQWLGDAVRPAVLDASLSMSLGVDGGRGAQPMRDLKQVAGFVGGQAISPVLDAPWAPIFLIALFLLHPALGFVALIAGAILFVISVLNDITTRPAFNESGSASLKSYALLESYLRNAEAVEAMAMAPALNRRFSVVDDLSGEAAAVANDRAAAFGAAAKSIRLAAQTAVLAVGALLVLSGDLAPGGMIAASILMGRALAPVDQLIGAWRRAVDAWTARGRLRTLLELAPSTEGRMTLPTPSGAIAAENVSLRGAGGQPILTHVSFALQPGEAMGLIGPSASGKTSLCRLLVGVRPPTLGAVRLDGADITQWSVEQRGRHVGYLPQDVELFDGTIAENIARMGEPKDEDVVEAARLAGAHDMIVRLQDGYNTRVGAQGALLSGGQRQRIALARALYGDPKLLVLDEPNANLDQVGDAALQAAIARAKETGVTVVLVAHRPSALVHVDKLLVLANGSVSAFGPRNEVMGDLETGARLKAKGAVSSSPQKRQQVSTAPPTITGVR
ncbi:MAG: type I secretion system permease/ATPase [Pseudomonadota bacterium]